MSGLEVPAFLIGVASLFSSCVDAFTYFKTAQRADEDVEILLLKLDIERTRLLVWGNEIGMFTVNQQHSKLHNKEIVTLLAQILGQIEKLLTDSETLRSSYGLRTQEPPLGKVVDLLSSKSLAIFRTSSSRFWTRHASRLDTDRVTVRGGVVAKIKWAIYAKEKFQGLVNDVKHFVDKLYELVPVDRETQESIIKADIESILDLSQLRLVEAATEDSYKAYSEAAISAIEASEMGTIDRRTVEERLRDVEKLSQPNLSTQLQAAYLVPNENLDALLLELNSCPKHVVLTSKCHSLQTQSPCDVSQLGSQSGAYSIWSYGDWNIASSYEFGGNTLWQIIKRLVNVKSIVRSVLEDEESLLARVLGKDDNSLTDMQRDFLEAILPLVTVYIYCSPCAYLIHTALRVCNKMTSSLVETAIRPDDRLSSSCCTASDRILGLKSILDYVRQWEAKSATSVTGTSEIARFLDRAWLERRLDHFEYEQSYGYQENYKSHAIILGEVDYLVQLLQRAPGRIPKATEIWNFQTLHHPAVSFTRYLSGSFTERRWPGGVVIQQPVVPTISAPQLGREATGSKRSSSSVSTETKRQKLSAMPGDGDTEGASSENSVANSPTELGPYHNTHAAGLPD
ncbi:hypothetical protein CC78DRAFT_612488 [Lojkania enalia]|uniref:Prion-inhibition and propagation HeLo domain-containing protein n=1 Tax=Lojkania enalia TaxID=147567 RepID=A0A9P4NAB1_9PLEO|nr:hypothetical protein CC78DRAFT_612488 [Didymosphaeria enalia]